MPIATLPSLAVAYPFCLAIQLEPDLTLPRRAMSAVPEPTHPRSARPRHAAPHISWSATPCGSCPTDTDQVDPRLPRRTCPLLAQARPATSSKSTSASSCLVNSRVASSRLALSASSHHVYRTPPCPDPHKAPPRHVCLSWPSRTVARPDVPSPVCPPNLTKPVLSLSAVPFRTRPGPFKPIQVCHASFRRATLRHAPAFIAISAAPHRTRTCDAERSQTTSAATYRHQPRLDPRQPTFSAI